MRKSALVCLLMLTSSLAFGQVESNSITVSVSRNSTVQPDQVLFAVTVQSGLSTSLDDVLAAVQGAGITQANFAGVATSPSYTLPSPPPMLSWTFTLTVPFAKQKDTITSLTALQQTVAQGKTGLSLSFTVAGTQASAQALQAQTCSLAGLVSDAQTQAQNLAAAAGVTLGPVLALSSATSSAVPNAPANISLVGAFVASTAFVSAPLYAPPCALTVRFGLMRF